MIVQAGSTNVTTYFVLRTAANGTATTGATITAIDLQYVRSGAAPSAKVDATALAATDSAHADNKAIEVDGTDAKGLYRVDWPDAAFAAGVREVILSVTLASSFTEHLRVELSPAVDCVAIDGGEQSATDMKDFADTGYDPETHKIQGVLLVDTTTTNTDLVSAADVLSAIQAAGTHLTLIKAVTDVLPDAGALTTIAADAARLTAERAAVLTDWINGGRLDLILDIIAADTTTDIPALIATAQSDLDKLTGSDGATLATSQGNYAPAKAGNAMDLVSDAVDAAALKADATAEIVAGVLAGTIDGLTLTVLLTRVLSKTWNSAGAAGGVATLKNSAGTTIGTQTFDDDGNRTTVNS